MLHVRRTKYIATAVIFLLALATETSAQFEARNSSQINAPQAVAIADFNHDGNLDVATFTFVYSGRVAILLGNGNGTFRPPVYYNVDSANESLAWITAADFNGDGNADLAVVDVAGWNISILLGNGDGTFQPPVQYPTTQRPDFVAVGDFNNDGSQDLIVLDSLYVSIMLGNGDGTFQPPIDNGIFKPTGSFALGDFDHDGNLDVAVPTGPGTIGLGILLGNGDGTFRQGAQYSADSANSVAAGDFNGDGNLDLAVAEGNVEILLGNGDGTFQYGPSYPSSQPAAITTADVNGDGNLDFLFITSSIHPNFVQLALMLGDGDGTFQPQARFSSFEEGTDLAVGDFNGDHKPDVVVADFLGDGGYGSIDVLLNTGAVSFSPTAPVSFHAQLLGSTSPAQNITVTNTGTTPLSIASISIKPPFQLTPRTTCHKSVAAGANCTLSVTFAPSVAGLDSGLLVLSDSASSKPQVIELNGTGTTLTVSPSQLNFGSQKVGTKSKPQDVTVTNTGSVAVKITSVSFTGTDAYEFTQTNTCGTQIGPGSSCTISITFQPTATGTRSAAAQINGPPTIVWQGVSLVGTGT